MLDYEKKHIDYVHYNAAECALFLKRNETFPISSPCKVALFGEGGKFTMKGGTGSGDVNSRYYSTILSALRENGFEVTSEAWADQLKADKDSCYNDWLQSVIVEANEKGIIPWLYAMGQLPPTPAYNYSLDYEGDLAIYVLSRVSGEGGDRQAKKGDIYLSDEEIRDIRALNQKFDKFLLVLNTIGYVDLSPILEEIGNILYLSQLGVETGNTFVDILLGRTNPSGKLTTTWAKYDDYQTIGDFGNQDETRYKEGIYVGYRYFDTLNKETMFPFGYGLSYTDFTISHFKTAHNKSQLTITCDVKNIGKYSGKEVVQAYLSKPQGKLDQPYQELCGFTKSALLNPDALQTITIQFDLADMASYDSEKAQYILEKGDYILRVGNSSRNTEVVAKIVLKENIVVRKVKNIGGQADFKDFIPDIKNKVVDCDVVIELNASDFNTETVKYEKENRISDYVKSLSDSDLVRLCIGRYILTTTGSVIESFAVNNNTVPGAAGETTVAVDSLKKTLVMADGPAGLRLMRDYAIDDQGYFEVKEDNNNVLGRYDGLLPKELLDGLKALRKGRIAKEIHHQYTTAIPIGTAIAQSFNIEFAEALGNLVGEEMELFHVNFWLAPALNIHRHVLCGRNFEYYSEDPLVSGQMAAAITLGVQKHKGCSTTLKHYCANNQETNRFYSDSILNERALREIYLKGFEIAVKKSHPHAIMTSYNLLNNIHTAQRYDLNHDVLRCEWGFDGLVMSDWGGTTTEEDSISRPKNATKAPASFSKNIIGENDLMMSGCPKDYEDGMAKLADGSLTREQLEICGSRIYRLIEELNQ